MPDILSSLEKAILEALRAASNVRGAYVISKTSWPAVRSWLSNFCVSRIVAQDERPPHNARVRAVARKYLFMDTRVNLNEFAQLPNRLLFSRPNTRNKGDVGVLIAHRPYRRFRIAPVTGHDHTIKLGA